MLTVDDYFTQKKSVNEKLNSQYFDTAKQHLAAAYSLMEKMNQQEIKELEMFVQNLLEKNNGK